MTGTQGLRVEFHGSMSLWSTYEPDARYAVSGKSLLELAEVYESRYLTMINRFHSLQLFAILSSIAFNVNRLVHLCILCT